MDELYVRRNQRDLLLLYLDGPAMDHSQSQALDMIFGDSSGTSPRWLDLHFLW
jgi:hypothetical protein